MMFGDDKAIDLVLNSGFEFYVLTIKKIDSMKMKKKNTDEKKKLFAFFSEEEEEG